MHQNLGASPKNRCSSKCRRLCGVRAGLDPRTHPPRAALCGPPRPGQLGKSTLWLHLHPQDDNHATTPQSQRGRSRGGPRDLSLVCGGAAEFLCHSSASHAARGPTPQVQAQPVGPKVSFGSSATPSTKGKPLQSHPGGRCPAAVWPAWAQDRHPGNGQSHTRRPPQSEWIPVRVPALIDPETWDRAQGQLARNRARAAQQYAASVSVASLVVCGRCGRRMVGTWSAQGGRYICALALSSVCAGGMHGRSLGATLLEACVWEHVKALLS